MTPNTKHEIGPSHPNVEGKGRAAGAPMAVFNRAFTLVELLVVVATVGVLAAMMFSARANTAVGAQTFVCLNNLRQLQQAWRLYADDYVDMLPRTGGEGETASTITDTAVTNGNWVHGRMDIAASSTNTALIEAGSIFAYSKSLQIYKCPADKKATPTGILTVRSYSMNCWLNPIGGAWNNMGRVIYKVSDMDYLPPASTCVVIEENSSPINDGWFVENALAGSPTQSPLYRWIDFPAVTHNNLGGLSFADGHVEMRRWSDPAVVLYNPGGTIFPTGPDLQWFCSRMTVVQ